MWEGDKDETEISGNSKNNVEILKPTLKGKLIFVLDLKISPRSSDIPLLFQ